MSNNEDYRGCFGTIALICGAILVFYAIVSILKGIGNELKHNPDNVMGWIFGIGAVAFIVYKLMKK